MIRPLPSLVTELDLPFYFVMGEYDFMTSSHAAKMFFDQIEGKQKEFIAYKNSAHYRRETNILDCMVNTFIKQTP